MTFSLVWIFLALVAGLAILAVISWLMRDRGGPL
jgi:hypothetical protein